MDFSSFVGQKEVIDNLRNSIADNKVGHAYIFTGPKGIGKKTLANIFSGLLLCEKKNNGDRCGSCIPCRMLDNSSNPDFYQIEVEGESIGVDEIREMQSDTIIRPLYSDRKIYLIVDADKMTVQAQNSLLKTLEEPPSYVLIILTVSNYDALLETIRSRVIRYNFRENSIFEVKEYLKTNFNLSGPEKDFIAQYSGGVIGIAKDLASSDEFSALRDKTIDILLELSKSKLASIFDIYEFFNQNKNNINTILDVMLLLYRDLIMVKKGLGSSVLINSDKSDIILNSVDNFSLHRLFNNIDAVELTRKNIKQNVNFQLSIEGMLMKIQEG